MPRFPLADRYELLLDGTWTDITGWVYERDPVVISRGRSAEAQHADPAKMTLTLDNRDGRFSPRNPMSPWYGVLGRNTQIRASLPYGSSYLPVPFGQDAAQASTPDASGLDITGDLDVRADIDAEQWQAGDIAAKYLTTGDNRSWWFGVETGNLEFIWSPDGTFTNRLVALSTEKLPITRGRLAVRAALDVDNGSGGWTVTFYTADTISGAWTQFGDAVTGTGTTSVHAGTAPLEVGGADGLDIAAAGNGAVNGRYLAFELRDGIDGTLAASPGFSAQDAGTTSFNDGQGNTWTLRDAIDDRRYRFHGEVASWPATWRMGGHDAYVKITASGVKRRLTQNAPPLRSTMYREFASPAREHIIAYWPMEDGSGSTQIAAAGAGTAAMTVAGSPDLGSYSDWTASDPLPVMDTGMVTGTTPSHIITGQVSVRLFVFVDELPSAETSLLHLSMVGGTVHEWDVRLTSTGGLRTRAYGAEGTSLLDNTTAFNMHSRGFTILNLELSEDGSDIDWVTLVIDFDNTQSIGDSFPGASTSGTLSGQTLGTAHRITVGRNRGLGQVVVGHLTFADDLDAYAGTTAAIVAHNGENPGDRMARLCDEEEVEFTSVTKGTTGNDVTLGDQLNRPLVELLEEATESDGGILFEPRDGLGFAYRSRLSLYNQQAAVTLDYSDRQVAGDLTPVDDDRSTVNDLTVKREHGSSVHAEDTTGPMSTADPPGGVGRYPGEVTLSLEDDDQLPDQAGWRLHLGTVDEARYPQLTVFLRAPAITDELYDQVLDLDVGDRVVLTGIPEGLPPDDVSLLVQGYTESMRLMQHGITFNLTPESPWHVGQADTPGFDRVDTAGSTLAVAATATATTLEVRSGGVSEDFEDTDFAITVTGDWVRDSSQSHSGSWSLSSGTVTDQGFARAVVSVPTGAKTLAFWWKVSSEAGFDFFTVSVDGITPITASGEIDWHHALLDVEGAEEVVFRYDKDVSTAGGSDRAWIDEVWFDPVPLWTTDTDDLPFDVMIAGERCTVTAVSGTTSPQTFTVTRSVNGVAKAQSAGASVTIAEPVYVAL